MNSHELSFNRASLHQAYAAGTTSAEVIIECYRRIEKADDPGIFIHICPIEAVIAQAEALGEFDPATKPLFGLPFAIKDNIDLAGTPTTAACPAYSYTAENDAFVVALLRAAGAIPIGKTNLDQFATGLVGVRTPYPVPRNAIDADLVPGGSSSGSAVATARGLVTFALGTDTAGSGRVPAALNKIVGLKPSLGALSATGVVPACRTLDTVSIFAPTISDAYAVFTECAKFDQADAFAKPFDSRPLSAAPSGLKIGVPSKPTIEFFGDLAQELMFEASLGKLTQAGNSIVPLDFSPFYDVASMLYQGAWVAERLSVIEDLLRERPKAIHPTTAAIIRGASELTAVDAFRGIYRLQECRRRAEAMMADVDLLCVPTIPTFYTLEDLENDPITPNSNLGTYTNFVNLMDLCGIAVPSQPRSDGKPGSITLLGRSGDDSLCVATAQLFEEAQDSTLPPWTDQEMIDLAVCGAHMSGLPLNGELTSRGAKLLKTCQTADTYRLYALPGGPPHRPGLLRSEAGESIELEVWSMPKHRLGDFVEGIPAPLGIGRITLADGDQPPGFLVEARGVDGAKDITGFKSWRAFLASQMSGM